MSGTRAAKPRQNLPVGRGSAKRIPAAKGAGAIPPLHDRLIETVESRRLANGCRVIAS